MKTLEQKLLEWALGLINCSGAMCSMAECNWGKEYAKDVLEIIKKHQKETLDTTKKS